VLLGLCSCVDRGGLTTLGISQKRVLWLLWDTSPAACRRLVALVCCKLERSSSGSTRLVSAHHFGNGSVVSISAVTEVTLPECAACLYRVITQHVMRVSENIHFRSLSSPLGAKPRSSAPQTTPPFLNFKVKKLNFYAESCPDLSGGWRTREV